MWTAARIAMPNNTTTTGGNQETSTSTAAPRACKNGVLFAARWTTSHTSEWTLMFVKKLSFWHWTRIHASLAWSRIASCHVSQATMIR